MSYILEQDFLEEEDTQKDRYLTFAIDDEFYGIEIKNVIEIVGIQPITQIPERKDYIKGIINLRGKILPLMDVRARFKKDEQDYHDRTCIIIVNVRNISIGLIVDGVAEVITIKESSIVPPPEFGNNGNKYVNGIGMVGDEVKLLLDCDKLLGEDETEDLSKIYEEE